MMERRFFFFTSPPPTTSTRLFLICHASINDPPPSTFGKFSSPIGIDIEIFDVVHNNQFFIGYIILLCFIVNVKAYR